MNKDTVVASIIGFSLGLVAAIALWVVPRVLPKQAPATDLVASSETGSKKTPDVETNEAKSLVISAPQDGEIVNSARVGIKGTAEAADFIIISTPKDSIVLSPSNGEFSENLDLTEGNNELVFTKYSRGQYESKRLNVFYYAESF
ncbi:MAG: hypothetical protein AAB874_03730 [Patescibacteria group bacterium]